MPARPSRNRWPMWRSCSITSAQPISESYHSSVEGDGANNIGGTGLFPLGWRGPDDVVELNKVHRAAPDQERVAINEALARADKHAGAEGHVHLVTAPCDEVCIARKGAMRRELGPVDGDRYPSFVSGLDYLVESVESSR